MTPNPTFLTLMNYIYIVLFKNASSIIQSVCIHIVMGWIPLLSHIWGLTLVLCNYGTNTLILFRAGSIIHYIKQVIWWFIPCSNLYTFFPYILYLVNALSNSGLNTLSDNYLNYLLGTHTESQYYFFILLVSIRTTRHDWIGNMIEMAIVRFLCSTSGQYNLLNISGVPYMYYVFYYCTEIIDLS